MVSLDTLSEEQQEKISQYQAITQIHDLEQVLGQMIEHDWNLERAIQDMFDDNSKEKRQQLEEEVATSTTTPAAAPTSTPTRNLNRPNINRPFMATTHSRPFLVTILFWPFGLAWNITWSIISFASRLFFSRPTITNRNRDPRVLAVEFIEKFESKYGSQHVEFFKGGYSQALEKARKDLRFLLVILQSDDHDDTELFNRETLTSNRVINFIKDKNILVWAGNVHETEPHKVSYTLNATTYPFMALIALQQQHGSAAPKMSVIERIEGPSHPEELVSQVEIAMDRHGAVMKRLLHEREQRELERQLRVDQDAAYRESLKADQEKARKQQEEKEEQERLEKERQLEEEKKLRYAEKRQQYIQYLLTHLEQEPSDTNVAKFSFRLADGDRVIRKFSPNATLDTLYRFVEVYPLLKENTETDQVVEAPEDYEHMYKFTIHSPFPRMEYAPDTTKKIVDIKSLWPSATLVVDAVDDEDDEE